MKSLHDQIAFKCVHFNGISNDTCEKGMSYDEVDKDLRIAYRSGLPCFAPVGSTLERLEGRLQCQCPHLQFPTEQEVQAEIDGINAETQKMAVALAAINPIRKEHKGKNWRGVIECPCCKGRLHVAHHGYNNHVHAKCETEGCVAWME